MPVDPSEALRFCMLRLDQTARKPKVRLDIIAEMKPYLQRTAGCAQRREEAREHA